MSDAYPKFVAAAIQAAPVFLNRDATVDKACELIAEAANNGARLIAFSEAWVPTFPYWSRGTNLFEPYHEESLKAQVELIKNAIAIPDESTQKLCRAARNANACVMIGISERDPIAMGTLYNTQLYIDRFGKILGRHRKLVPTGTERVVWKQGNGSDLRVFETDFGRLGGLICFENFMPLARAALIAQGQQIHLTHFPGSSPTEFSLKTAFIPDIFCRYYAYEAQVFVINVMGYLRPEMVPDDFPLKDSMNLSTARGGSVIISPSGKYLAGPIYDEETILYAEIDLEEVIRTKAYVDTAGHYARWDVTQLLVNSTDYGPFTAQHNMGFPKQCDWNSIEPLHDKEIEGIENTQSE